LTRAEARVVSCRAYAAAAAVPQPPQAFLTLNEVLAQLGSRPSSHHLLTASTSKSSPPSSSNSNAAPATEYSPLPPFQSDVELQQQLFTAAATSTATKPATATASATTAQQQVSASSTMPPPPTTTMPTRALPSALPALPMPPRQASTMAVIAVSPTTPAYPPPYVDAGSAAAALAAAGPAVYAAPPMLYLAMGTVACILGSAISAFLLAFIPTLQALRGAADEIANLAASIREEVPDTMAAVRISGMELTDCLEEVGELTAEVGSGVKSTSRVVGMGFETAGSLGQAAASTVQRVLPEVRARATPVMKRIVERTDSMVGGVVRENANTEEYSGPAVAAAARATKSGVQYARGALRAAGVARTVGKMYRSVKDWNEAGSQEASSAGAGAPAGAAADAK